VSTSLASARLDASDLDALHQFAHVGRRRRVACASRPRDAKRGKHNESEAGPECATLCERPAKIGHGE
jgi:hypothetical protein